MWKQITVRGIRTYRQETEFTYYDFLYDDNQCTDLWDGIRAASREFFRTRAGRVYRNQTFGLKEFWENVPDTICQKHGIQKGLSKETDSTVDLDTPLFPTLSYHSEMPKQAAC